MPEIKTKHKSQPVLNTAQQQMQRSFVRAKQEQAVHRQSEQSESPSNYAEEKVSRTAEDTVRDAGSLLQHEIRSVRHSGSTSESMGFENSPESSAPAETRRPTIYSGSPAARERAAENAGLQETVRKVLRNRREVRGRGVRDATPIRTRERVTDNSAAESGISPAQQAARKAAAQDITGRKKQQKEEELGFERTHFSQQVEATQASPCTSKASDTAVTESTQVSNGFHNTSFSPGDTPTKKEIPIKKKPNLPIRTRNSSVPIKTSQRAAKKVSDTTAKQAAQKAQKAATAAAQKSVHAAATAGRRAALAAKKAAELTAKLARSAAEAVKALYAAIGAGGVAALLVIVIVVLIGCGAVIFGSQDDSTETLPLSAEVEAYEPVIRKYAKQYGIPDYVLLIQTVMMQESGGRGNDPMQASECGYNTQYPRTPGGITNPEYSIAVGIQNLADCLQTAGAESPIDLEHIQLALQGYNFGSGYITWALQKYGEYSRANAVEFSMKMAEQMGWNSYGDKQYVPRVLRYYPIGKVFYTPEDGDAIVDVALTQVGNVGGKPYWSWYGFTSRVEWCACFVSWCADQCGYLDSGAYPKFSGCVFGMQWFQQRGLWLDGSAEPMPGMLIFFDWATQDGVPDHVGIVERVENNVVYTVEGNSKDMCRQKQYSLGSRVILGYGMPASV